MSKPVEYAVTSKAGYCLYNPSVIVLTWHRLHPVGEAHSDAGSHLLSVERVHPVEDQVPAGKVIT
jgi:hypothetical protein